jgi:type I restriction enzyme M protein
MTEQNQKQLGKTLSGIADQLRGAMSLDDFCDNRFSFLILRYISITSATAPTL